MQWMASFSDIHFVSATPDIAPFNLQFGKE